MTITAVFVLFATIWFLILFFCLQINIKTQADSGEIVAGTHASSPIDFSFKKRAILTTMITIPLCALLSYSIAYGYLTRDMFDFLNVLEK